MKNERFLYEKIDFSAFQEKTGAFRGIHGSFFGGIQGAFASGGRNKAAARLQETHRREAAAAAGTEKLRQNDASPAPQRRRTGTFLR